MSLDNFQMPAFIAGELYKDSLIDLDSNQLTTKSLNVHRFSFLGENKKNIIILIEDKNSTYLPDDDLRFLIDILTACNLSMQDVALVNIAKNEGISYQNIQEFFKPDIIICMGVEPDKLAFPLSFPAYQVQQYNQQQYLISPDLKKLSADKKEKLQLWNCLKKIFSI